MNCDCSTVSVSCTSLVDKRRTEEHHRQLRRSLHRVRTSVYDRREEVDLEAILGIIPVMAIVRIWRLSQYTVNINTRLTPESKRTCAHAGPYSNAVRTVPCACTGTGGWKRISPVGGSAYLMPKKRQLNLSRYPTSVPAPGVASSIWRETSAVTFERVSGAEFVQSTGRRALRSGAVELVVGPG